MLKTTKDLKKLHLFLSFLSQGCFFFLLFINLGFLALEDYLPHFQLSLFLSSPDKPPTKKLTCSMPHMCCEQRTNYNSKGFNDLSLQLVIIRPLGLAA